MNSSFIEKLNNKLNMIELTSKPIVENAMAWQQHGTPNNVIDMMLDMYYENGEFKNNEKILILFNVEIIKQIYFKYRDELIFGNLYFVADSKEKFDIVKRLYPNIHCVLCDQHNIENLIKKIGEFNVKKFDIVYSNPPYNDGLDIKILKSLKEFKICTNVIFIHPSSFVMIAKKQEISKHLYSMKMFWANKIFNIGLFVPACISVWNFNSIFDKVKIFDHAISNNEFEISYSDISFHGSKIYELNDFLSCINKKIKQSGSILDFNFNKNNKNKRFFVKTPILRGHPPVDDKFINPDFFTVIGLNIEKDHLCEDDSYYFDFCKKRSKSENEAIGFWGFETKNEALNFLNFLKTKFVRFCLSFIKFNAGINHGKILKTIPWLDFTQEWNDAKLCKEFGINEELWQYIDNFIPDYYDDYKSGFENDEEK